VGLTDLLENVGRMKDETLAEAERIKRTPFTNYLRGALENTTRGLQEPMNALNYMPLGMTIKAYHGSPYKFKKFADEAIGTGEGVQAFGYGHYMTDSPNIANTYAKDVYNETQRYARDISKARVGTSDLAKAKPLWESAIKNLEESGLYGSAFDTKAIYKHIYEDLPEMQGKYQYETRIFPGKKPSEYTLLEWDKPVSKDIMQRINSSKYDFYDDSIIDNIKFQIKNGKNYTGEDIFNIIREELGNETASDLLRNAGIHGIKYPSGTLSGVKGSKNYNYVIFNPGDIKIKKVKSLTDVLQK
jgi:hypothetical protein